MYSRQVKYLQTLFKLTTVRDFVKSFSNKFPCKNSKIYSQSLNFCTHCGSFASNSGSEGGGGYANNFYPQILSTSCYIFTRKFSAILPLQWHKYYFSNGTYRSSKYLNQKKKDKVYEFSPEANSQLGLTEWIAT